MSQARGFDRRLYGVSHRSRQPGFGRGGVQPRVYRFSTKTEGLQEPYPAMRRTFRGRRGRLCVLGAGCCPGRSAGAWWWHREASQEGRTPSVFVFQKGRTPAIFRPGRSALRRRDSVGVTPEQSTASCGGLSRDLWTNGASCMDLRVNRCKTGPPRGVRRGGVLRGSTASLHRSTPEMLRFGVGPWWR